MSDCRDEIDNAYQDAARYRWLRTLTQDSADVMMQWGAGLGHDPAWLDAAIDEAMARQTRYRITEAGRKALDGGLVVSSDSGGSVDLCPEHGLGYAKGCEHCASDLDELGSME